jgi:RHS repeat-associated protein
VTVTNEKSTRTNTYDSVTGDLVFASDSAAGAFVGVYDADARLVGTVLPGGMIKTFTFDSSGKATYTAYNKGGACAPNCLIYQQASLVNIHGQQNGFADDMPGQESTLQYFDYDAAGRLARVKDNRTPSGTSTSYCTQREYTLDSDSNRLSKVTRPETVGSCAQSGGTSKPSVFDDADRLTSAGYSYDAFGRITTAPAADTGGSGALTATYYVNDLARSITQDGVTQTLDLDPLNRMSIKTKSGGASTTETYAYTDDSDSPAFTQTGSTWNRIVPGVAGAEVVQDSVSGVKVLIQNLRGDVVAQSTPEGVLSNFSRVDEFGVPKAALPPGAKYAFHGSSQRETMTAGGTIAMGVRLYQPQMGRFLQVDPVIGGSLGPYEYCYGDPINCKDLDGRLGWGDVREKLSELKNKLTTELENEKRKLRRGDWDILRKMAKQFLRTVKIYGFFSFMNCTRKPTEKGLRTMTYTQWDAKGNASTYIFTSQAKRWSEIGQCGWRWLTG